MKIKRVKIVNHESGWKGTWYETGEKHYVIERRANHLANAYHAVRLSGGINDEDCVEMTDIWSRILCIVERLRILAGLQTNYACTWS